MSRLLRVAKLGQCKSDCEAGTGHDKEASYRMLNKCTKYKLSDPFALSEYPVALSIGTVVAPAQLTDHAASTSLMSVRTLALF